MRSGAVEDTYVDIVRKVDVSSPLGAIQKVRETDNTISARWITPILDHHRLSDRTWKEAYDASQLFDLRLADAQRGGSPDLAELRRLKTDLCIKLEKLKINKEDPIQVADVQRLICIYQGLNQRAQDNDQKDFVGLYRRQAGETRVQTWKPFQITAEKLEVQISPGNLEKYIQTLTWMQNHLAESVKKFNPETAKLLELDDNLIALWRAREEVFQRSQQGSLFNPKSYEAKVEEFVADASNISSQTYMFSKLVMGNPDRFNQLYQEMPNKIQESLEKLLDLRAKINLFMEQLQQYQPTSRKRAAIVNQIMGVLKEEQQNFESYETCVEAIQLQIQTATHSLEKHSWGFKTGTLRNLLEAKQMHFEQKPNREEKVVPHPVRHIRR